MSTSAPRISPRLRRELERLDDPSVSTAEICRRLGEVADRLGLTRPSYQRIRVLVNEHRRLKRNKTTTTGVALDVMFRVRPPEALVDHLAGSDPPPRE